MAPELSKYHRVVQVSAPFAMFSSHTKMVASESSPRNVSAMPAKKDFGCQFATTRHVQRAGGAAERNETIPVFEATGQYVGLSPLPA